MASLDQGAFCTLHLTFEWHCIQYLEQTCHVLQTRDVLVKAEAMLTNFVEICFSIIQPYNKALKFDKADTGTWTFNLEHKYNRFGDKVSAKFLNSDSLFWFKSSLFI